MTKKIVLRCVGIIVVLLFNGCSENERENSMSHNKRTFAHDVEFVGKYLHAIVLASKDGMAKLLVVPQYQGRVMTSTTAGDAGLSLGWINYDLIAAGQIQKHINAFGGEDRFWLGPEGGQFSIFFKQGDPFDLTHWQTPPAIDSEPYEIIGQSETAVHFRKEMQLTNYSGINFNLQVDREVVLLDGEALTAHLGLQPGEGVNSVAFETNNEITNIGDRAWDKAGGLLSIWILGMFNPSEATTVVIPMRDGVGPDAVNDSYFGEVPADRLVVKNGVVYFSGDGKYRSKIGIPPAATRPVMGSYDAINQVLTIVQFTFDSSATDYVNSAWELQEQPYGGDVANSYNDGPPSPGAKPLGPFYELESSSMAKALEPGEQLAHTHRTFHFTGATTELDKIARHTLGTDLATIRGALQ